MDTFYEVIRDPEISRRFKETMELCDLAFALQRQNLRRRNPELSEEEVNDLFQEWLLDRPGDHTSAEFRPSKRLSHLIGP